MLPSFPFMVTVSALLLLWCWSTPPDPTISPSVSLRCNDLLVPVFYFWSIALFHRDYKKTTWAAQSLHLWWMTTWGKAALPCHIGVLLTRSLLCGFAKDLYFAEPRFSDKWGEVAIYCSLIKRVVFWCRRCSPR